MRPSGWSMDAGVLVRPSRTFLDLSARPPVPGAWTALRRPLLHSGIIACMMSLLSAGVLTPRLFPLLSYWLYVPLVEVVGLLLVTWPVRRRPPASALIDAFFVGCAPMILFLIAGVAILTSLPPAARWWLLTGPLLLVMVVVLAWSAYIDVCFFRSVTRMPTSRAVVAAIGFRMFTWTLVFLVFAMASSSPANLPAELADALREVMS